MLAPGLAVVSDEAPEVRHWIVTAFIHLGPTGYVLSPPDAEGWCDSRFLGRRCRLRRHVVRDLGLTYQLDLG
jgi:hypothetical protein